MSVLIENQRIIMLEVFSEESFPENFNKNFHTHLLCHKGSIMFHFNDLKMICKSGEFVFWFAKSRLAYLQFSTGFRATALLVEERYLNENIPDQNWGIDATLHSRQFPVKQLNDKNDRKRILSNFHLLYNRSRDIEHRFYNEALKMQMQLFILEMWHTFAKEYELRKRSLQTGTLYEKFILLLQDKCLTEREVRFYADELNITAKYLNFISKQNSGITASKWIQRYTRERVIILLQDKQLNIAEIADRMEFSSRSFFTRYVKKLLGLGPREFRNRLE